MKRNLMGKNAYRDSYLGDIALPSARRPIDAPDTSRIERRRSLMKAPPHIPRRMFSKIHALMPILRVDVVVMDATEVLLVQRATEPLKDQYFIPGGRLQRGETFEDAAHRVAREEVGLVINWPRFVGYQEFFLDADPFGHGRGTHSVSAVFVATRKSGQVRLNRSLKDSVWEEFDEVYRVADIPHYLRRIFARVARMKDIGDAI